MATTLGETMIFIFLIALALRFGFGLYHAQPIFPGGDSIGYMQLAERMHSHQFVGYSHPPVYPVFLYLFGEFPKLALYIQSFLSAMTAFFVYALGKRMVSKRMGLIAAVIVALDPFQIFYSGVFLSETVGIFLLMLTLYTMDMEPVSGFIFGIACLCRSIFVPLVWIFPLYYFMSIRSIVRKDMAIAFLVCWLIPVASWSALVYAKTGHVTISSSNAGATLWDGLTLPNQSADAHRTLIRAEADRRKILDASEGDKLYRDRAIEWIKANPRSYFGLMSDKFFKFYALMPSKDVFARPYRILSFFYMLPLLVCAFFGGCVLFGGEMNKRWWVLMGIVVVYTLVNLVFWTQIRYRVPLHPILALFAAYFVEGMIELKEMQ